jgi:hypothetical protein
MKYFLEVDERWPDFSLATESRETETIELTAAEHKDWVRVRTEYTAWQKRFKEAYDAAR